MLPGQSIHILRRTSIQAILTLRVDAGGRMSNLTIRLNPEEKARVRAWAAARGVSAPEYIKALVAADMAAGNPHERAAAWFRGNEAAIAAEAERVKTSGVPGSHLALNRPWPD